MFRACFNDLILASVFCGNGICGGGAGDGAVLPAAAGYHQRTQATDPHVKEIQGAAAEGMKLIWAHRDQGIRTNPTQSVFLSDPETR